MKVIYVYHTYVACLHPTLTYILIMLGTSSSSLLGIVFLHYLGEGIFVSQSVYPPTPIVYFLPLFVIRNTYVS